MKKLFIVCSLVTMFAVGTGHAQQYEVAPCGTKAFTTAADVIPGGTICLDIWLTDADGLVVSGGAWLDFTGSVTDISYVSGGRCLTDGSGGCTGPWDPAAGVLVNEPAGVGTVMYTVGVLAGIPLDSDGDVIVGTVTLQNIGPNDATVNITTIPGVQTWIPVDNADVGSATIVISQVCYCAIDAHCDDGLFCNGVETCDASNCTCDAGTNPCPTDTTCNEDTDTCDQIPPTGIPTLSEWGIIFFMTIILGIGIVTLLRRRTV
jgi:hypothetical protein